MKCDRRMTLSSYVIPINVRSWHNVRSGSRNFTSPSPSYLWQEVGAIIPALPLSDITTVTGPTRNESLPSIDRSVTPGFSAGQRLSLADVPNIWVDIKSDLRCSRKCISTSLNGACCEPNLLNPFARPPDTIRQDVYQYRRRRCVT